jgi:uncharacterized protein
VNAEGEAAAAANRTLRRGLVLSALTVIPLALWTGLAFWEVIGLPLVLVLLPALALAQLPLLRGEPLERIPVYLGSIASILALGLLSLMLGLRLGGWEGMRLVPVSTWSLVVWTGGITLTGIVILGLFTPLGRPEASESTRLLAELLPRSPKERWVFAGLSGAAGVGEELAFRGYALLALQALGLGPWPAALLASGAFGVVHAYQGLAGMVRTGVMGVVLSAGVLSTGSLFPAMAAHALVDLIGGLVLGPALLRRARSRSRPLESPREGG